MIKRSFKIFYVLLLTIGVSRFCHKATDGFRLTKIQNNTFAAHKIHSSEQEELACKLLSQPFTYLARGKQSFVFLSQDGKTVLKLLNNHYQKNIKALQMLPKFTWQREKLAYFQRKMQMTCQSYQLAFADLREETGLLFLHLEKTNHLKQNATIIDKLGIAHVIDLDRIGFILQKRATLAYPQFEEWIEKGDILAAKRGILSLLTLLHTRLEKGLSDRDPLIRTNIGFIDGKAHFLDLGPFSKNVQPKPPELAQTEIRKITHSLRDWLAQREPGLALFFEEEIQCPHAH